MATQEEIASALAQDVRKKLAEQEYVRSKERHGALSEVNKVVAAKLAESKVRLDDAKLTLTEITLDPSPTDNIGAYSQVDQALRAERFAGKSAAIDHIKANPTCSQEEALTMYDAAALAAVAPRSFLIQNSSNLVRLYAANAAAMNLVPDDSWLSFRALVLNLDKETLMSL